MTRFCIIFTISLLGFASCIESETYSSAEWKKKTAEVAEKCRVSHGAALEQINGLADHFTDTSDKINKAKCLSRCIIEKLELVNDDGKLVAPKFMEFVRQYFNGNEKRIEKGLRLFEVCREVKFLENCGLSEEFKTCLREARASQRRKPEARAMNQE